MQCSPIAAAHISVLNWLLGVPAGTIRFLHITIEYET